MKPLMGCFFLVLLTGVFWVIGFFLLGSSLWSAHHSMRAAAWPTTPGTITRLEVHKESDSDGTTYEVKVRYAYTVDGVAYESTRLAFGYTATSGRAAHDEIYRKLEGAKAVAVRYDPAESCLSYGLHRSIQLMLAFSIGWLVFIFAFTLLWWLSFRSDAILLNNLSVQ